VVMKMCFLLLVKETKEEASGEKLLLVLVEEECEKEFEEECEKEFEEECEEECKE
jgi:hypothetical protein